jgi:hypothetical protein
MPRVGFEPTIRRPRGRCNLQPPASGSRKEAFRNGFREITYLRRNYEELTDSSCAHSPSSYSVFEEKGHETIDPDHCILRILRAAELVWNVAKTRVGQKISLKISSENLFTRVIESSNED